MNVVFQKKGIYGVHGSYKTMYAPLIQQLLLAEGVKTPV